MVKYKLATWSMQINLLFKITDNISISEFIIFFIHQKIIKAEKQSFNFKQKEKRYYYIFENNIDQGAEEQPKKDSNFSGKVLGILIYKQGKYKWGIDDGN